MWFFLLSIIVRLGKFLSETSITLILRGYILFSTITNYNYLYTVINIYVFFTLLSIQPIFLLGYSLLAYSIYQVYY